MATHYPHEAQYGNQADATQAARQLRQQDTANFYVARPFGNGWNVYKANARTCERCGSDKPAGQSCGCFDNDGQ